MDEARKQTHGKLKIKKKDCVTIILLVFGKQDRTMISDGDIVFGEISSPPSTFPLPLFGTVISDSENAKKRNQEILIERIPNEPYILIPDGIQKPKGVDPR